MPYVSAEEKRGLVPTSPKVQELGTPPPKTPSKVDRNDATDNRSVRGRDWLIRRRKGRRLSGG